MTTATLPLSPFRASGLQRAWLCPVAPWREQGLPDNVSDEAEEGTRLHDAVRKAYLFGDMSHLSDDHRWIVTDCCTFIRSLAGDDAVLFEAEMDLLDASGEKIIENPVHADVVIFKHGGVAVVIDFKMGRLGLDFTAEKDLQLLSYAVAVRNNYVGIQTVNVYRYHPRLYDERRQTCVAYSGLDADWFHRENVLKTIVRDSKPLAKAVPGETQCRYCKAKANCPDFHEWSVPAVLDTALPTSLTPSQAAGIYSRYAPKLALFTKMMEYLETYIRDSLVAGIDIDGYALKPGSDRREITDVVLARRRLKDHMPGEALDGCTKMSIGALEKAFKACTGLKGRQAESVLNDLLSGTVTIKTSAPSLVRTEANNAKA